MPRIKTGEWTTADDYARSIRMRQATEWGKQSSLRAQIDNNEFGEEGDSKKVDKSAAYLLALEAQVAYTKNNQAAFQEATRAKAAALIREAIAAGKKTSEDDASDAEDSPAAPPWRSAKEIKDLRAKVRDLNTDNKNWQTRCAATTDKLPAVLERAEKADARIADMEITIAALASNATGSSITYVERTSMPPVTQTLARPAGFPRAILLGASNFEENLGGRHACSSC
jgi:hypothetical protein